MLNRDYVDYKPFNLSQSAGLSTDEYCHVTRNRGLAPIPTNANFPQLLGISCGRDMLRKYTPVQPESDLESHGSFKIQEIVDNIIDGNLIFKDLNRVELDGVLKSYLGKIPYDELISIGKKEMEIRIKKIMATEHFLNPGFFIEMPYRKRTTINAKIGNITRGLPSVPDFED